MSVNACPICGAVLRDKREIPSRRIVGFECPVCGSYRASSDLVTWYSGDGPDPETRALLSGVLRHASDRGDEMEVLQRNVADLAQLADPPKTALGGEFLEQRQATPDKPVGIDQRSDYPVFYARSPAELKYYIRLAKEMAYLETVSVPVSGPGSGGPRTHLRLTARGWERAAELHRTGRKSDQAFVAMWFEPGMTDVWENGFKPALVGTGFSPLRIDLVEHNRRIDDEIIAQIGRSGLLVADFTGHRQGVYFEAGLAMGLSIPVIWTCRKDALHEAHFDTRQYNHIGWATSEELRARLENRIRATVPRP